MQAGLAHSALLFLCLRQRCPLTSNASLFNEGLHLVACSRTHVSVRVELPVFQSKIVLKCSPFERILPRPECIILKAHMNTESYDFICSLAVLMTPFLIKSLNQFAWIAAKISIRIALLVVKSWINNSVFVVPWNHLLKWISFIAFQERNADFYSNHDT